MECTESHILHTSSGIYAEVDMRTRGVAGHAGIAYHLAGLFASERHF